MIWSKAREKREDTTVEETPRDLSEIGICELRPRI